MRREIKNKLICSAPAPAPRQCSDPNPWRCISHTMSLLSIIFSSHQISLLSRDVLFLDWCLLHLSFLLSIIPSLYCNRDFCLRTACFAPWVFNHNSLEPLCSFLSLPDCSDCVIFSPTCLYGSAYCFSYVIHFRTETNSLSAAVCVTEVTVSFLTWCRDEHQKTAYVSKSSQLERWQAKNEGK